MTFSVISNDSNALNVPFAIHALNALFVLVISACFSALKYIYICIYIDILEWTRALNARSQLATCEVAAAFVDSKRRFVSLWNRVG